MVLLVVDTQKLITTPDLYNSNAFEKMNFDKFIKNINNPKITSK